MKQDQQSDTVSMWSACPEWASFMLTSFYRDDEREHAEVIQAVHKFIAGWISDEVDHSAPRIGVFGGGPASGKTVMSYVLRKLRDDDAVGYLRGGEIDRGSCVNYALREKRFVVIDPANDFAGISPRSKRHMSISASDITRNLVRSVAHSDTVDIDRPGRAPVIVTLNHRLALMTNARLEGLDLYPRRCREIIEFEMQSVPRESVDCSLTQCLTSKSSLVAVRAIAMLADQQNILPDGVSELRNMLEVMS